MYLEKINVRPQERQRQRQPVRRRRCVRRRRPPLIFLRVFAPEPYLAGTHVLCEPMHKSGSVNIALILLFYVGDVRTCGISF